MQNSISVIENDQGMEVFDEPGIIAVVADYLQKIFTAGSIGDLSQEIQVLPSKVTAEMNSFLTQTPTPRKLRRPRSLSTVGRHLGRMASLRSSTRPTGI